MAGKIDNDGAQYLFAHLLCAIFRSSFLYIFFSILKFIKVEINFSIDERNKMKLSRMNSLRKNEAIEQEKLSQEIEFKCFTGAQLRQINRSRNVFFFYEWTKSLRLQRRTEFPQF